MFFLLYIPIINQPLSQELIEQMAAQLAERLGPPPEAEGGADSTGRDKKELQKQIIEMMKSMQERARNQGAEASHDDADTDEDGPAREDQHEDQREDQHEDQREDAEAPRLAPARDFLERCFKNSQDAA